MTAPHDLALDRLVDWEEPVEILEEPTVSAAVDAPLWTFHLPGQHNQQSHGGGGDDDDGPGLDDEGPSEYDEGLSGSYLGKYGSVKDHYAADTNHAIIVPERGRMHVADDTRGRENREVLQEVTPKQANAISDDVWEVSQGGSGRDSAAGVRVDTGGGIPAGSADWTGAVDVTWSNGRTSEYSFDDAFELQEGLTIMAGLEASALWQFGDTNPVTAAARRKPRRVSGPSLQELDDAADQMAALVAVHLGRVAGFAARSLGGLTVAASGAPRQSGMAGLWSLTAAPPPEPGPGTARQAAVSADDLAVITDTWQVVVTESLAPALAASYVAAAESQAARLAAALPAELAEAFAQPLIDTTQASLLYASEASNRLVAIGDELWSNARTSLVEGMAAGEDIPKLAARVRAATQVTLPRATVIARTETIGARNAGSYDEMVASGVVTHKRWLATNDNRTRPAHRLAGGLVPGVPAQTVPIGSKFNLGGWPCDYPGDPALPPEQGISCRCSLVYEVGDDETVSEFVDNLPQPVIEDRVFTAIRGAPAQLLSYAPTTERSRTGYVRLVHVREALPYVPREKLDPILTDMARGERIVLAPNEQPRARMPGDNEAALRFGDEPMHWIRLGDNAPTTAALWRGGSVSQLVDSLPTTAALWAFGD